MKINVPDFVYRLQEGKEIISPKVDFAFKKFFGAEENKDFLIDFLQSLLDIPKDEYDEVSFENTTFLKDYDKDKYGILDVLIKTKHKKIIHIEIQVGDAENFRERALYYLSRIVIDQMASGKHYSEISKTISILVLNYELIHDTMNYKNVYRFSDLETKSLFSDKLEIITLELPKIPTEVSASEKEKRLISWLEFLKVEKKMEAAQVLEKYPYLQKAYDKIQELSRDPENNVEYTQRLISHFDEINRLTSVERGVERGYQQGAREKAIEIAKKLLEQRLSVEQIAKTTGLSVEEVLAIK